MKRSVYIIKNVENEHIKIGIGFNASKRLKQLQTGSSSKLELVYEREVEYASRVEKALHSIYSIFRVHGEWFQIPDLNVKEFDSRITLYENNFIILNENENPFI